MVLVTGASSGLGLVLARQLIDEGGYRLVLTARESSLRRFAAEGIRVGDHVRLVALDVTDRAARRAVVADIQREWGGVDILVNNAGVAYRAVLEHVTEDELLTQMAINFRAPLSLTRHVLPGMRARGGGRIINISSVGGMMAMPTMTIYNASKFALEGAMEALWYEVRPWNIHVTLVEPGFIRSESFENTRYTADSRHSLEEDFDPYHAHYFNMKAFIERYMRLTLATPERIAVKVRKLMRCRNPPLRMPATLDAHLFSMMRRLLPRRLYHAVLYRGLPHVRSWGCCHDRGPVEPGDRSG